MNVKTYEKYDEFEKINIGDLISIIPNTSFVTRSRTTDYKNPDKLVVGVCVNINGDLVDLLDEGIVDVNVEGIICIGDRLTTSKTPGKARAIRNDIDEIRIFEVKPIGKVVGLYNDYTIAKVLLGVE